jgi:hypothetical protein
VIAIKNARISEYQGKSLNCGDDHSTLYIEPSHNRTLDLQKWYASTGGNANNLQSLSGAGMGEGSGGNKDNYRFISEMMDSIHKDDAFMNGQSAGQYFKVSGYVMRIIYDENRQTYFIGCPDCKKKVNPERDTYYRCENCNKTYSEHEVRVTYTLVAKF